jgi:hypothetical protein
MHRIFWSWQSDSPSATNRTFVFDCLKRAARALKADDSAIIEVDRDSQGVGGSPTLADVILTKIEASDVFVWDATIVSDGARPAPNPNVLFEAGYAYAALGGGRIIGVFNDANGRRPDELPFDLRHRRWPIRYSLTENEEHRGPIRDKLVSDLTAAIRLCLGEAKRSVESNRADAAIAARLWRVLDSTTMSNWWHGRQYAQQYEDLQTFRALGKFCSHSALPENRYSDNDLRAAHDGLVSAISAFIEVASMEMTVDDSGGRLKANAKHDRQGLSHTEYERQYRQQLERLGAVDSPVWAAWESYVAVLNARHHTVLDSSAS